MNVTTTKQFKKAYDKLPQHLKNKTKKAVALLKTNFFYPSLHTKKMQGINMWEGRVDRSYRFTFDKENDTLILRTVGPHDEGLGKK